MPARISRNQTSALGHRTGIRRRSEYLMSVPGHVLDATDTSTTLGDGGGASAVPPPSPIVLSGVDNPLSVLSTPPDVHSVGDGPDFDAPPMQNHCRLRTEHQPRPPNEHQMRHQPRHQPHLSTRPYRVITSINTMTHRHIRLQPNNRRPIASD